MAVKVTGSNTDDRQLLECLTVALGGKAVNDKGYIAKSPMKRLWQRGLNLLTALVAPMENHHLPLLDKLVLRKRSSIATLSAKLKRGMGLSTTTIALPPMALSISPPAWRPTPWPNPRSTSTQLPSLISPDFIQNWGYGSLLGNGSR